MAAIEDQNNFLLSSILRKLVERSSMICESKVGRRITDLDPIQIGSRQLLPIDGSQFKSLRLNQQTQHQTKMEHHKPSLINPEKGESPPSGRHSSGQAHRRSYQTLDFTTRWTRCSDFFIPNWELKQGPPAFCRVC